MKYSSSLPFCLTRKINLSLLILMSYVTINFLEVGILRSLAWLIPRRLKGFFYSFKLLLILSTSCLNSALRQDISDVKMFSNFVFHVGKFDQNLIERLIFFLGFPSLSLKRAPILLGDGEGWHWDELDVLASLSLILDIKYGFLSVYIAGQKKLVRPPLLPSQTVSFKWRIFF